MPDHVDEKLWVEAGGYKGRLYPSHNPHTFPGRIGAWLAADDVYVTISKNEITECSEEARYWIDGFLVGNEADADEMFGAAMLHDALDDDPRWERWRGALAQFRRSGVWMHERWRDLPAFPPWGGPPPVRVGAARGRSMDLGRADMVLVDPQPLRSFHLLDGTLCAERHPTPVVLPLARCGQSGREKVRDEPRVARQDGRQGPYRGRIWSSWRCAIMGVVARRSRRASDHSGDGEAWDRHGLSPCRVG